MSVSKLFNENTLSVFQSYALSQDKAQFLNTLPSGLQKNILTALSLPYSENLQEKLTYSGIPYSLATQIVQKKLYSRIQEAKSVKDIQDIFEILKIKYASNIDQVQPAQVRRKQQKKGENQIMEQMQNVNKAVSKLELKQFSSLSELLLNILKNDKNKFQQFTAYAIRNLPQDYLLSLDVKQKSKVFSSNLFPTFSPQFVNIFLNKFAQQMTKLQSHEFQFPEQIYRSLPTKHLQQIVRKNPQILTNGQFLPIWFSATYQRQNALLTTLNQNLTFSQREQKRKLLNNILKDLQKITQTQTLNCIIRQIQLELLVIDLSLQDPDLDRFYSYMQKCSQGFGYIKNSWRQTVQVNNLPTSILLSNLNSSTVNLNSFIEEYLLAFFNKYKPENYQKIDQKMLQIFDDVWYKKLKAKKLLSKGEQQSQKILSQPQKLVIRQQKQLSILKTNKSSFKLQQQVILKLKLKNIQTINIKIYELSLQKHYLQNKGQINDQIDLHYLGPTLTCAYQIDNKNPYKEQIYDLEIKEIKKQRGVYIVDIDGAGMSSRAVIRKGTLFCMTRVTVAGVEATFLDEVGKKVDQLSLWIRGQLIKAKGTYLFPFGSSNQNISVIAVIEDFAQVFNIQIPNQAYNLSIKPYYNKESFIVGSKAKIVLSPKLTLLQQNSRQQQITVSLKLLKNVRSSIILTDHQGIRSIINYQNIRLTYQNDFIIQLPIQTYIRNIDISVSAQVTKLNGQKQDLYYSVNIPIVFKADQSCIYEYYLRKTKGDYVVHVLGMDGEPIVNLEVPVHLKYKWVEDYQQHVLTTDQKGEINLGVLQYVKQILIQHNARKWYIGNQGYIQLGARMCYKQGQVIRIPLPPVSHRLQLGTDINLFSNIKQTMGSNYNHMVKVSENALQIAGLTKGIYSIQILSLNYTGSIIVLRGQQWQNQNQLFDKQSSTIYQFLRNSNNHLTLSAPTIQNADKDHKKITVSIQKPQGAFVNNNIKAHILAYSFFPTDTIGSSILLSNVVDIRSKNFKLKQNSYYNNKKLSEQAAYVINRKEQKQFVGNNLEKPHILLKTIKVRDTVLKQQEMKQQTNFTDRIINTTNNNGIDFLDFDYASQPSHTSQSAQLSSLQMVQSTISQHNNFLKYAGLTIQNLKSQTLQFTVPNHYNYISIILSSNCSQSSRNILLQDSQLQKKNIKHPGLPKQQSDNLAWSMSREIYSLGVGQDKQISRNSRWCAVTLSNIFRYAKAQNIQYDEWLQKWNTYAWDYKLQIYNKKICHQLNSYIKHQDRQFFSKVVLPFIKNKINKTFVDYCLIQDPVCQKWGDLCYFEQLNQFEKVLFIEYLAKKGKFQFALVLAKSMELLTKSQKESYAVFKQKFQSMLNVDATKLRPDSFHPPPPRRQPQQMLMDMLGDFSSSPPPPPPGQSSFAFEFGGATAYSQPAFGMASYSSYAPPPPPPIAAGMFGGMGVHPRVAHSATFASTSQMRPMSYQRPQQLIDEDRLVQNRTTFVQQFKQVQKTCQYTEITYNNMKNASQNTKNLVSHSRFWSDLALYFAQGKNKNNFSEQLFINQSVLSLSDRLSFNLALAFLPSNLNPDYQISSQGSKLVLKANKPFLLLIKQLKQINYEQKSGIMINHRFINQNDKYIYEQDGGRIQKEVSQFIIGTSYTLQTLLTNTTSNTLQLQLLIDLPQGSIPLQQKQYTKIINVSITAYSTKSFDRHFYFPSVGEFSLYAANACWVKNVIAKAQYKQKLVVREKKSSKKMDTLMDVLEEGETDDIVMYISTKNIFDRNMFKAEEILWMLKDKEKYEKITKILRQRGFIDRNILRFGFVHQDLPAIKQYLCLMGNKQPIQQINNTLAIFQYFPYYSSRAHKYENTTKSKIRNIQLKQTYYRFLFEQITYHNGTNKTNFKLSFAYFLLLQDRIDQATNIVKTIKEGDQKLYQIQFDYLCCFVDMYTGMPNYSVARKIVGKYQQYPVLSWRALFNQVAKSLRTYDTAVYVEDQEKKIQYSTTLINQGRILRISIPENHRVQVLLHSINLQLAFSNSPFSQIKQGYSVRPAKVIVFQAGQSRQEKVKWEDNLKDVIVQVFESGKNILLRKVSSLLWANPKLKVKVNEKIGSLQVFYENKPVSGNYCKVYSNGGKGVKFYRDGYTDITGSFRYALSELNQIDNFSILCTNQNGGIISKAAKPSQAGQLSQI